MTGYDLYSKFSKELDVLIRVKEILEVHFVRFDDDDPSVVLCGIIHKVWIDFNFAVNFSDYT